MIKINLKNVASFGEHPVVLETDQKVNLVYGLNGTGKTTLSDFLYFREKESKFKDCMLDGISDEKILVYNQSFVQENFHNKDELKGIFTLSKENKEAEEAIEKSGQEKQNQEEEKATKQQKKIKLENEKNKNLESTKETLFGIKRTYAGGDRVLEFCLKNLQLKRLLFGHINGIKKPENKPDKSIETLKSEAGFIIGENARKYEELQLVDIRVRNIEQDNIFSEVIIGNEYSPVANLIKKLNNSDWVKQGVGYLPDEIKGSAEQCPFCQQDTITEKISQDIRSYFDEAYEKQIEKIKQMETQYKAVSLRAVEDYGNHALMQDNKDQFEKLCSQLQSALNKNSSNIKNKLKEPSQKIKLVVTESQLTDINDLIITVNQKIQDHNKKIENKKRTQQDIKNIFWQIMRWDYDNILTQYQNEDSRINTEIEKLKNDIERINNKIRKQETKIVTQQRNMVNIEEAIRNINKGLDELGVEGFRVQKYEGNSYRIIREGQSSGQFSTLSEGEKMIISFLYFMELCKGRESEEEIEKDKIVVIDDPVSSLSHTYVFNLSQWIKEHYFDKEGYTNVFVLTHSLYFFHELIRCAKNKLLFRFTKSSSKGSQIQSMQQDEIKNEYESYWQVIQDHSKSQASDALLASSMRNILEHFFGFLCKSNLSKSLENLDEENKFTPFHRYITRESHSDAVNITDNKEIDAELFKSAFRNVFTESGYEEHYKKMMREENGTPN